MKLPIGPGALVASAFSGVGIVIACTRVGAAFGYALVFATLASACDHGEIAGKPLGVWP